MSFSVISEDNEDSKDFIFFVITLITESQEVEFSIFESEEKIQFGDNRIVTHFKNYMTKVREYFVLTCKPRCLCIHEFEKLKILDGIIARDTPILFPNHNTVLYI